MIKHVVVYMYSRCKLKSSKAGDVKHPLIRKYDDAFRLTNIGCRDVPRGKCRGSRIDGTPPLTCSPISAPNLLKVLMGLRAHQLHKTFFYPTAQFTNQIHKFNVVYLSSAYPPVQIEIFDASASHHTASCQVPALPLQTPS
jgi:hypothetical protein